MSITGRLKLAFLGMIIVPQLVLVLLLFLTWPIIGGSIDLRNTYEVNRERELELTSLTGEVRYALREHPERLEDDDYLQELIERYGQWESAIRVEQGGRLIGESPWLAGLEVPEVPEVPEVMASSEETMKHDGKHYYVLRIAETNGGDTSITLLLKYETLPFYLQPLIMLIFLVSIAATLFILAYLVSGSLTRPLGKLRRAAEHIEAGHLDYQLEPMKNHEIGQVRDAFENMRLRLKESIDQSVQVEHNRKELISNISHDLKTPITAIKGYVEGLLDGVANTEEMQLKYIQTIYKKATEMDVLINELFLYSKLDLNEEPYELRTFNLVSYLEDYLEECRYDIEKTSVRLTVDIPTNASLPVFADGEKLSRVLSNILDNSLKYMKRMPDEVDKQIEVSLREEQGMAVIGIRDSGPGIDEEALPHIFDRFYRAEQSRNSALGGSGLGLAIVKRIVEGHGGQVDARSRPGEGSLILLRLPLVQENNTASITDERGG
ncbi:two-component sensor histidine kinase [Paenibacillus sp. 598K]|uniref:sensor histidine kinase n=1 Tax=Paenibacillus sp. 598K TaxID=1117987 RepID=UPI000FFAFCE0|nr:HAMP domain-containing sensor histidine kinase [Paenibacillus sp. 598K]GBF78397.1 two-component sensor histidine kinase [Paenibacillus sp. 598K]